MSSFKLRKEKDCLNCGHSVEDHFCPHCGQENIELKEDAVHMVAHAIADYFHFEHKFFATTKPLLFQPGKLTTEYVTGKRVKFIHPIRLYIFVSIVFFIFAFSGINMEGKKEKNANTIEHNEKNKNNAKKATQSDTLSAEKAKAIEESLKYIPNKNGLRDSIIKKAKEGAKEDDASTRFGSGRRKKFSNNWNTSDTTVAQYEKNQAALTKDKRDGFIKHYFLKRTIELNKYENPEAKFVEDFVHKIPKMMFLLLPMFALILKLVYINKKKYYYEHLIYSFHVHSAIFLSILISMLLQWLIGFVYDLSEWITLLCMFYIIWYIYRSLRTFYGSTRWVTVLKMFFLSFAYNVVLTLCFLVIIAISFAMV